VPTTRSEPVRTSDTNRRRHAEGDVRHHVWLRQVINALSAGPPQSRVRRVQVSAKGEVTRVEVSSRLRRLCRPRTPCSTATRTTSIGASSVWCSARTRVATLPRPSHPCCSSRTTSGCWPFATRGWLPHGTGHGVPPGTSAALCGAVPQFVWLGPCDDPSTEGTVRPCRHCLVRSRADEDPPTTDTPYVDTKTAPWAPRDTYMDRASDGDPVDDLGDHRIASATSLRSSALLRTSLRAFAQIAAQPGRAVTAGVQQWSARASKRQGPSRPVRGAARRHARRARACFPRRS